MIIYINGFNSNTSEKTKKWLIKNVDEDLHIFDYDWTQTENIKKLECEIDVLLAETDDLTPMIIGKSLGGLIAEKISEIFDINAVLINPSLFPNNTLKSFEDIKIKHYTTGVEYRTGKFCKFLSKYSSKKHLGSCLVLLDADDEFLNSCSTAKELSEFYMVHIFEGGSHGFQHLDESKKMINRLKNSVVGRGENI